MNFTLFHAETSKLDLSLGNYGIDPVKDSSKVTFRQLFQGIKSFNRVNFTTF